METPASKTTSRTIFIALAADMSIEAVRALAGDGDAERSTPGIVLGALSLLVMPLSSRAQRRAGRELGSASAVADSKRTLLCTSLSALLLVGLVLDSVLCWWWAGPRRARHRRRRRQGRQGRLASRSLLRHVPMPGQRSLRALCSSAVVQRGVSAEAERSSHADHSARRDW
jgi:hypothetical protein